MILSRSTSSSTNSSDSSSGGSPVVRRPAAQSPSFCIDVTHMRSALAAPSPSNSTARSTTTTTTTTTSDPGEGGACAGGVESSRASPSSCPPLGRTLSRATTVCPAEQPSPRADAVSFREERGQHREHQQRRRVLRGARGVQAEEPVRRVGDWVLGAEMGRGCQGRTCRGEHAETRERVVVKALRMRRLSLPHVRHLRAAFRELHALEHPNLLRLEDVVLAGDRLYTVAPDVHGVALGTLLRRCGRFPEALVKACCVQVLDALRYLRERDVVHGAVHPNNIILDLRGVCRLADLDLRTYAERRGGANAAADADGGGGSIAGRPAYTAPEVARLEVAPPGFAADIWALGCTAAELLEGAPPFSGVHPITVLHNLVTGVPMPAVANPALSDACRAFLAACFTTPHTSRPSAVALRHHAFLAEFDDLKREHVCSRTSRLATSHTRHGAPLPVPAPARPGLTLDVSAARPEDEDDAFETAARSLDDLRKRVEEATMAATTGDTSDDADKQQQQQRVCEELMPALNECVGTQEYLLNYFAKLQDERDSLLAEQRATEVWALAEQRKQKNQKESSAKLSTELTRLRTNAQHLERAFSAQRGGIEQLANTLYGRLTGNTLGGTCATLDYSRSSSGGARKWRPVWVVLRDNFLFIFKKGAVSGPTEILLLDPADPAQEVPPEFVDGRKHCFRVSGRDFAASTSSIASTWVSALQHITPWYESATPFAEVPPPAAPAPRASSRDKRRYTIGFPSGASPLAMSPPPTPPMPRTPKRVFGVPIAHAAAQDPSSNDSDLPAVVDVLVGEVIARGLDEEGILRVPGDHEQIQVLRSQLEKGPRAADINLRAYGVTTVTGVLKMWLRDVPASFIPDREQEEHLVDWVTAHPMEAWSPPVAREFEALLSQALPRSNRVVLTRLCELVARIIDHGSKNLMDLHNIMICLAPSLKVKPCIFSRMVEDYRFRHPSGTPSPRVP